MRYLVLSALMLISLGGWADEPIPSDPTEVQATLRQYYFDAARAGDTAMLAEFIDAGFDLATADDKGYTALILSAYHGHLEAVEQLLAAGADACAQDKRGNTALMGAIFKGELRIARRLLDTECNPDQPNVAGQTAAMYAALFQRKEMLDALKARGADLNAADAVGNTPQTLATGEIRSGY